jgi:cellulose synthase/poly-beta-1,6-N-acetylglucosamine synthase-like glycosyltransferase
MKPNENPTRYKLRDKHQRPFFSSSEDTLASEGVQRRFQTSTAGKQPQNLNKKKSCQGALFIAASHHMHVSARTSLFPSLSSSSLLYLLVNNVAFYITVRGSTFIAVSFVLSWVSITATFVCYFSPLVLHFPRPPSSSSDLTSSRFIHPLVNRASARLPSFFTVLLLSIVFLVSI